MCVAVPGRVLSVSTGANGSRPGIVTFPDGSRREVDLVMVPGAGIDDFVVTHSGLAIAVLSEEEATRIFQLLEEIPGTTDDRA